MLRILISVAFLCTASLTFAQFAADSIEFKNIIKFDTFGALIDDAYTFSYERATTEHTSLVISLGYLGGYFLEEREENNAKQVASFYNRDGLYVKTSFRYYLTEFTGSRRPAGAFASAYPYYATAAIREYGRPQYGVLDSPPFTGYREYDWRDLTRQTNEYGLGLNVGGQVFLRSGLGAEFLLFAQVFYIDDQASGFQQNEFGQIIAVSRREIRRDFTIGAQLNVMLGW